MKVEIRGAVSPLQSQLRRKGARQEGGKKVNKEVLAPDAERIQEGRAGRTASRPGGLGPLVAHCRADQARGPVQRRHHVAGRLSASPGLRRGHAALGRSGKGSAFACDEHFPPQENHAAFTKNEAMPGVMAGAQSPCKRAQGIQRRGTRTLMVGLSLGSETGE